MAEDDIPFVDAIAKVSFPTPWSAKTFWREIQHNDRGHYWVLKPRPSSGLAPILSYGGYWQLGEEAHIVTIATHPEWRRCRLAECLMLNMLCTAQQAGVMTCSLEVRESNHAARCLYARLGFVEDGRRNGYYSTGDFSEAREDALILSLTDLGAASFARQRKKMTTCAQTKLLCKLNL